MPKIGEDYLGPYVAAGGYIARPYPSPFGLSGGFGGPRPAITPQMKYTGFRLGETVKSRHHAGSMNVTVRTDDGRQEDWYTLSMAMFEYKACLRHLTDEEFREVMDWHAGLTTNLPDDYTNGKADRIEGLVKKARDADEAKRRRRSA